MASLLQTQVGVVLGNLGVVAAATAAAAAWLLLTGQGDSLVGEKAKADAAEVERYFVARCGRDELAGWLRLRPDRLGRSLTMCTMRLGAAALMHGSI